MRIYKRQHQQQSIWPVLKVVWKSWGFPLTTYPFPLSPPSVYDPTPPELGGSPKSWAWGLSPPSPLTLSPAYDITNYWLFINSTHNCSVSDAQGTNYQVHTMKTFNKIPNAQIWGGLLKQMQRLVCCERYVQKVTNFIAHKPLKKLNVDIP